jgi:hypothetical protein
MNVFCSEVSTSVSIVHHDLRKAKDRLKPQSTRMQAWWGIMCLAQSAPTYNGLEGDADLRLRATGDTSVDEIVAAAAPAAGSRADAANQLWANLVSAWVEYGERDPITCATTTISGRFVSFAGGLGS